MSRLYFQCAARSAVGLVRNGNEDSALVGSQLIAVADGMGGHAGGEFASSVAINTLSEIAPTFINLDIDSESASDLFLNSLHTIDSQIHAVTLDEPQLAGMGTTLTALFINNAEISLLHIGDSRAYRLRGNDLEQLSADHTVLQELLNKGIISEVDAQIHPQRSMLTQALMGEGTLEPSLLVFQGKIKDRYLICSDGLTGVLSDKEIKSLIKGKDLATAVDALIEATYINGAPDNVTIILADIVDSDACSVEKLGAAKA
ncbi:MAG: protein phosphatase 2C domain-containing protein [Actinomycetota bacterium]|nr:protein phosphatase 2C domain-containing protein [Actinomycetota bacterium]